MYYLIFVRSKLFYIVSVPTIEELNKHLVNNGLTEFMTSIGNDYTVNNWTDKQCMVIEGRAIEMEPAEKVTFWRAKK